MDIKIYDNLPQVENQLGPLKNEPFGWGWVGPNVTVSQWSNSFLSCLKYFLHEFTSTPNIDSFTKTFMFEFEVSVNLAYYYVTIF